MTNQPTSYSQMKAVIRDIFRAPKHLRVRYNESSTPYSPENSDSLFVEYVRAGLVHDIKFRPNKLKSKMTLRPQDGF